MVTLPIVTLLQAITYWMVKNILKEIDNEVD
jgi:YQGE family putative transporter